MSVDDRRGAPSLDDLRRDGYVVEGEYPVDKVSVTDDQGSRTVRVHPVYLHEPTGDGNWNVSTVLKPERSR